MVVKFCTAQLIFLQVEKNRATRIFARWEIFAPRDFLQGRIFSRRANFSNVEIFHAARIFLYGWKFLRRANF